MKDLKAPFKKEEIQEAIKFVYSDLSELIHNLPFDHFNLRIGEKWTVAEHLQHLILSSKPVASALKVSKMRLLAMGVNIKSPKSYPTLLQLYKEILQGGQKAPAPYVPKERDIANKQVLIENWDRVGRKLVNRLDDWGETQLNRFQLPHPAFGKISVREMMFATIFHTRHHHKAIENILILKDIAKV